MYIIYIYIYIGREGREVGREEGMEGEGGRRKEARGGRTCLCLSLCLEFIQLNLADS